MGLYHAMRREHGPDAARGLARKILQQNSGNVSRAASILEAPLCSSSRLTRFSFVRPEQLQEVSEIEHVKCRFPS